MDSPLHLIVVIHGHTFFTPQIKHVLRILDGIFKSFQTCPSLISTQAISNSLCMLKNKKVFQSKQDILKLHLLTNRCLVEKFLLYLPFMCRYWCSTFFVEHEFVYKLY